MFLSSPALLLQRAYRHVRKVVQNTRGGVLILTAVSAPVLFLIVGFGIDYAYASFINQRIGRASDAAALAAVSQSAASSVGGYANTAGLQTYGTKVFTENLANISLPNVSFSLKVSQNAQTLLVTATASYTYSVPTFFGGIVGTSSIPVSGSMTSVAQPPTYINYYILVDVSNSMGIAATQADMAKLYAATSTAMGGTVFIQDGEKGCVFACHEANYNQSKTTEAVARANNVTLRIDSAIAAIQDILTAASGIAGTTKNISFGIYPIFNGSATSLLPVASYPNGQSTNYTLLSSQAATTIDLGSSSGTAGETYFQNELNAFNTNFLPANGTGASAASPLNYVFLITDGVSDNFSISGSGCYTNCVGPIDATWCNPIKTKATLGVIYTTYLPIYKGNNPSSNSWETLFGNKAPGYFQTNGYFSMTRFVDPTRSPPLDLFNTNLQSCATSTDYFFEATDGPSITTAMQALFAKTQPVGARLTQ